jgi:hypothetical protein
MVFIAVDGKGDPNTSAEYAAAIEVLYGLSYTIDDEPATIGAMDKYAVENGYAMDINDTRRHHEIYLSDPRKVAPEKLKTVIRHPIRVGRVE